MTMTETPPVPVGATWESIPCTTCGCTATGRVTGYYNDRKEVGNEKVVFDGPAPDPDCVCHCHDSWRMVHHAMLVPTTLPEGA